VERYNRTIATQLSLMIKRDDQRDWDQYLRHVEYAQLVGAQRVLGRLSPLFLKGGWEALDPIDVAMESAAVKTESKELGEWMEDLQRARQLAMEAQQLELGRQFKASAKCTEIEEGDTVWVLFPNVGKGRSRKLAFRMHGPYVVKKWLHGGKRVAVLGHESEPNDEILANVDRMVRKRDVPQRLKDAWKPIKLNLGAEQKKAKGTAEKRARAAERALERVDKDVADELRRELDDVELDLDKIVAKAYVIEGKREGWQYRVRFVGFGADDDEWYWEEDLAKTAPQELQEFNRKWERGIENDGPEPKKRGKGKKQKSGGGRRKKAGAATIECANVGRDGISPKRRVKESSSENSSSEKGR
jgi:hypothetical protein